MIHRFFAAVLLPLLLLYAQAAGAAESRYAFTLAPAERFEVGATLVERHGSGGQPMILIPGLASGPWAWQEAVRRFKDSRAVYVLTFPGFDGRPAVPGKGLDAARESIVSLIEQRKLVHPVLVGHSLGGTLALAVAAMRPELVGAVVSLDGLPALPGTEELSEMQRSQMVAGMKMRPMVMSPAAFAAQQTDYMSGTGVLDMGRADELAKLAARSDPAAVSQYMMDAFSVDLHDKLARIGAPVLLLVPYYSGDAGEQQMTEAAKVAYYKAMMGETARLTVLPVAPARHFAMFDAPDAVMGAIARFLSIE